MNGASLLRNAAAFFLLRSISYSALSTPNRTVSSAGPPSRSSWSSTVIFCAITASWLYWGYLHRTRSTVMAAGTCGAASPFNGCTRLAERDQLSSTRGRTAHHVYPLPMRIVLSYLTHWAQRSRAQARLHRDARSDGGGGATASGEGWCYSARSTSTGFNWAVARPGQNATALAMTITAGTISRTGQMGGMATSVIPRLRPNSAQLHRPTAT